MQFKKIIETHIYTVWDSLRLLLLTYIFWCLLFNPEDEGCIYLRNVS
jgi:hypothetical protein